MRALLLCHKAFLKAPYSVGAGGAPFDYNFAPDLPKTHYLKKTEDEVKRAIRCYLPVPGVAHGDLVLAATGIQNPAGNMTWETMTRDTSPFPKMPVCFDALKMWMFKAGFVSMRWLANIPAGYLFNFHRAGDQAVCHWGVSLGGGWAAGSNTSANWPGAAAAVNFRSGGSAYGEFTLASALEVCKHKYKLHGGAPAQVTIRQIDPTAVATYF